MLGYVIAQIVLCLLIAALIGFVVGWLLRGVKSRSSEVKLDVSAPVQSQSHELAFASTMDGLRNDVANLLKRIAPYETVLRDRDSRIEQLQQRVAVLETHSLQEANVISESVTKHVERKRLPRSSHRKQSRQEKKDDLKLIVGIGPVLERKLNKLGVYRFKQIARWSDNDVERIAEQLKSFGDRITREDWMRGARKLHKEKHNEDI